MGKNIKLDMDTLVQEERRIMLEKAKKLMSQGIKILDPNRIDISGELTCGHNVTIDINVIIEGKVILENDVRIGANCILNDSTIGAGTKINPYSLVEGSIIGENSFVGPYGRVRPGSKLGDSVQVGNFVEIKNATIESGCRINHLSFVGDANLGSNATIGAGTITCNHDGTEINHTDIGENAFVGSGCNLIAPIKVGAHSTIGAGSTVTMDVPEKQLTVARSKQVSIKKWHKNKSNRENVSEKK